VKPRIAIIDLLFRWPPDGGARVEVLRLLEFLSQRASARLFCSRVADDPSRRGQLAGLPKALQPCIEQVDSSRNDFISGRLLQTMARRTKVFSPDAVIIGDAWHYKPHLLSVFAGHRPHVRFFAHEGVCLKGHGHRIRDDKPCDYCYLDDGASFEVCRDCSASWKSQTRSNAFDLEWTAAGLPDSPEYPQMMASAMASCSSVIVTNTREAARFRAHAAKVVLGACGIEPEWLHCGKPPPRKKTGKWRILMPGRCDDYLKGLHVLVQAGAILQKGAGPSFEIAYTGSPRDQWKDYGWLKPLGWMSRESLKGELAESDLTVHPAVWPEPFGISALESIVRGTPAVVANHGGLPEIVAATTGGWTFTPNEPEDLAKQLAWLLERPALIQEASIAGTASGAKFLWSSVLERELLSAGVIE